jgi:ribonucleoside-diphosphate reductase alpha chain
LLKFSPLVPFCICFLPARSFPIKAPEGALTRDDVSALSQLELCLAYQRHWCEHKPSITVTVREEEWMDVGAWVYRHFDEVSGGCRF